ncbi:hypothetical protein diail_1687 [Diaporthe ilicicola]|nr:hypothetical protein diail_1687 [Diaporthe ilicicola]
MDGIRSIAVAQSKAEDGELTTDKTGTIGRNTPEANTAHKTISRLSGPADIETHLPSLRTLLQSCVNPDPSTSSIGFLAPLSDAGADQYWRSLGASISAGTGHLFATHAHRGEVAKLLVRPSSRRRGLGGAMMRHLEAFARHELGLRVLTLDTETDTPARAFYGRAGWAEWGTCPDYAAFADGRLGNATFFFKAL